MLKCYFLKTYEHLNIYWCMCAHDTENAELLPYLAGTYCFAYSGALSNPSTIPCTSVDLLKLINEAIYNHHTNSYYSNER